MSIPTNIKRERNSQSTAKTDMEEILTYHL